MPHQCAIIAAKRANPASERTAPNGSKTHCGLACIMSLVAWRRDHPFVFRAYRSSLEKTRSMSRTKRKALPHFPMPRMKSVCRLAPIPGAG